MAGDRPRGERMKRLWTVVVAAALTVTACAQGAEATSTAQLTKASGVRFDEIGIDEVRSAANELVEDTTGFGVDMLRQTGLDANKVVSPWGAMLALQMLRAGAGGTTAAELDAALGVTDDDAIAAMIGQLDRVDGNPGDVDKENPPTPPVFHEATGIFIDESLEVGQDYLATLGRVFDSGVYPVDFAASQTEAAINKWLSINTGGQISETPTTYDPETVISLLSTVFLAAAWQQPFSPASTAPADFTPANGAVGDVELMNAVVDVPFGRGAGWTGVQLPYSAGLAMQVFLPETGVDTFFADGALTDASNALRSTPETSVAVSLPKWDITTAVDLKATLEQLGVRDLFGDKADLTAISQQLTVTAAAQNSTITVGEKGTLAASVTQIDVGVTALPPQEPAEFFVANRPFVFQIIDTATGLPLFLGTLSRPDRQ
ncbi:serpin family protein [Gordonia rubripertincta]|uniref:Serpin family protein n=1 Tax=Gordonia rubripertincta TaxID=36822 RepID=A0ABT4N375_GORRU|nr:serpin family protein [Gordonia rubripertincta]MCZ4552761.1 serpin family protein [Gordonia rubripertincta]